MAKKKKASQNEAGSNTAEPSKMDGSIKNEELAERVIAGIQSARLTAEDLRELRERFRNLKKTEDIAPTPSSLEPRLAKDRNAVKLIFEFLELNLGELPSFYESVPFKPFLKELVADWGTADPLEFHDVLGSDFGVLQPD